MSTLWKRDFVKMKKKDRDLLFIILNILVSVPLMIYYVIEKPEQFPATIILGYFFSVIGAIWVKYKFKPSKNKKKILKIFTGIIVVITIGLIYIIVKY